MVGAAECCIGITAARVMPTGVRLPQSEASGTQVGIGRWVGDIGFVGGVCSGKGPITTKMAVAGREGEGAGRKVGGPSVRARVGTAVRGLALYVERF